MARKDSLYLGSIPSLAQKQLANVSSVEEAAVKDIVNDVAIFYINIIQILLDDKEFSTLDFYLYIFVLE